MVGQKVNMNQTNISNKVFTKGFKVGPCRQQYRKNKQPLITKATAAERIEKSEVVKSDDDVVAKQKRDLQQMLNRPYKYGWQTLIDTDTFPNGISVDVIKAISTKKQEPEWMLDFRLKAYNRWTQMKEPQWLVPTIYY